MLKLFYRLKKGKGVVLFAVIAVMTLLITMTSVAYLTARASYQTVISNYDFSQMYISTSTVSDMLIASLVQTSSQAGAKTTGTPTAKDILGRDPSAAEQASGTDTTLNYFTDLSTMVKKLISDGIVGEEIVGVSSNVNYADANNTEAILNTAANKVVEPGVLDAVKVTISLDDIVDHDKDPLNVPEGLKRYYITFTTVGYYRENTITISDTIYNQSGTVTTKSSPTPTFDTFFTATGQELSGGGISKTDDRVVVITTDEISDNAFFQNKVTIFSAGQENYMLGGIRTTGGLYITDMNCFKDGSHTIPAPTATERHDWIIGGDLVLSSNVTLDLNGNDLYVKGDLIIGNGHKINAGNVFVEGNVYFMQCDGGFNITGGTKPRDKDGNEMACGVYVKGNVVNPNKTTTLVKSGTWGDDAANAFLSMNAKLGVKKSDGTAISAANMTLEDEFQILTAKLKQVANNTWMSFPVDSGSNTASLSGDTGVKFYQTSSSTTEHFSATKTAFVWGDVTTQVSKQVENGTSYKYETTGMKVQEVLKTEGEDANLKTIKYANYSTDQATVDKVLTLDFSAFSGGGGTWVTSGDPITIGTLSSDSSVKATITYGNSGAYQMIQNLAGPAVIDLPYVKGGYRLEFKNVPSGGIPFRESDGLQYKIHTPDGFTDEDVLDKDGNPVPDPDDNTKTLKVREAMPIVLTANFYDSSEPKFKKADGTETDTINNAFSWGAGTSYTGGAVSVSLVSQNDASQSAKGYCMFEMGNYDWKNGKYVEYDPDDSANIQTVLYETSGFEMIGTLNQTNAIGGKDHLNPAKAMVSGSTSYETLDKAFVNSGSNDIKTDYDNKLILVSNQNGAKDAFKVVKQGSILCGYVYAPNGAFECFNAGANESSPIFGGLIVTDYAINQGTYYYGQPDPLLIKSMGKTLGSKNAPGSTTTTTTTSGAWVTNIGSNYYG